MLPQVLQLSVIAKSNENIDADSITASQMPDTPANPIPFDPSKDNRADAIISLLVAQFREAIQIADRYPLSVTPGAVPPMAARHVLNMAAFQLVPSTPSLQMVIMTDKGVYSPLQTFYKEGLEYLKTIANGGGIMPPSDPTGIDYLTAVDPNTNPPVCAVIGAAIVGHVDASTDGELSGGVSSGTDAPNGKVNGVKGDVYEQTNAAGQIIKIWEKNTSYGNTGWA